MHCRNASRAFLGGAASAAAGCVSAVHAARAGAQEGAVDFECLEPTMSATASTAAISGTTIAIASWFPEGVGRGGGVGHQPGSDHRPLTRRLSHRRGARATARQTE
jgi:hypothetical protein